MIDIEAIRRRWATAMAVAKGSGDTSVHKTVALAFTDIEALITEIVELRERCEPDSRPNPLDDINGRREEF